MNVLVDELVDLARPPSAYEFDLDAGLLAHFALCGLIESLEGFVPPSRDCPSPTVWVLLSLDEQDLEG